MENTKHVFLWNVHFTFNQKKEDNCFCLSAEKYNKCMSEAIVQKKKKCLSVLKLSE